MKAMVYLKGWPAVLGQQTTDNGMVILLDHGPIFKLATLHAFGPPRLQSSGFESWWQRMFKQWACTLDMIIWLEAPTELLVERINGRNQRHAVKGKAEGEAYDFLSHYQTAYEQILAKVSVYKAPTLLQFDTQQTPIEQIVDEILVTINDVSSIPSNI
jgi:deoxyadenosine/deoxycytidine kinase